MNKIEIINKLNEIMDKVEEIQLVLGCELVKNQDNLRLEFADNTLDNAYNNLVDTVYHLSNM